MTKRIVSYLLICAISICSAIITNVINTIIIMYTRARARTHTHTHTLNFNFL